MTSLGFSQLIRNLGREYGVSFISALSPNSRIILLADRPSHLVYLPHQLHLTLPIALLLSFKDVRMLVISFMLLAISYFYVFACVIPSDCISILPHPTAQSANTYPPICS